MLIIIVDILKYVFIKIIIIHNEFLIYFCKFYLKEIIAVRFAEPLFFIKKLRRTLDDIAYSF